MEFYIRFNGVLREGEKQTDPNGVVYAVGVDSTVIGIEALDKVRDDIGIPNLTPALVNKDVFRLYIDPTFKISLELARKSGHFQKKPSITVQVGNHQLDRFVSMVAHIERDPENGTIKHIKHFFELDEKAVVDAWKKAGFPLEWDLPEPTEDES